MLRLKELREAKKLNMRQAAMALEIPYTTYISYEKGDREPNSEMLILLAGFFNCSVDYLIGRDESTINDDVLDRVNVLDQGALEFYGNILDAEKENELIKKYRTLDEYGREAVVSVADVELKRCVDQKQATFIFRKFSENKVSAGSGFDLNDPDQWRSIEVVDTQEARMADFAVEVEGSSMEPDYHDGDIVYIVLASEVPLGQVGLFIQNGKGYIKEAGEGCIISRNPDYDDIFPDDGNIECKGRVIGVAELAQ